MISQFSGSKNFVVQRPEQVIANSSNATLKEYLCQEDEKVIIGGTETDSQIISYEIPIYFSIAGLTNEEEKSKKHEDVKEALKSSMFRHWCRKMHLNEKMTITAITFVQVVLSEEKIQDDQQIVVRRKVQYVKAICDCFDSLKYYEWLDRNKTGAKPVQIPGVMLIRDPTTLILIVIPSDTELQTILIKQPRIAASHSAFPSLPDGYLDENGSFCGPAADAIQNNLDICLHGVNVLSLTQLAFGEFHPGLFPSAGGCNEFAHLLFYRHEFMTKVEIEKKKRIVEQMNGDLKIHIVPLADLWKLTPDAKSLSAYSLYSRLEQSGSLCSV
eukprot:c13770_g1_i1.p1 GENE.c13770_g1_i1~~c13770_g1_i1.p1  ORF type:complete len:328 (+),score=115.09 c13770_g1_i1:35-1018(+)